MRWVGELWRRLVFFFRRGRFHRDLEAEMAEHLRMKTEALQEGGRAVDEARCLARREFGNALLLRERSRDMWGLNWLETLLQDLRFGLRQLRRNPGFTTVGVIALALGIGANTAIFSLVDAVMLKSLPVANPRQLYRLGDNNNCCVMTGTQNGAVLSFTPTRSIRHCALRRPNSVSLWRSSHFCRT